VNWLDWILLAIVVGSVLAGLLRGAVRTVFSLAGLIVGFLVASRESGALALILERWMATRVAAAVGFVLVFLGIGLAFALAAWLLRSALEKMSLTWLDRAAGAALGLLRGLVIVGVLVLAIEGLGGIAASRASVTYPFALRAGWALLRAVPTETRERLRWERLEQRIPQKLRALEEEDEIV
jgi:membrane protein required for colicin V production